jgi:hypothetical protein
MAYENDTVGRGGHGRLETGHPAHIGSFLTITSLNSLVIFPSFLTHSRISAPEISRVNMPIAWNKDQTGGETGRKGVEKGMSLQITF